jgi:hypothetical protein
MEKKIKTIQTNYIIKVNNELVTIKPTLKLARETVKALPINDDVTIVHIVKQTVNESILDTYETKTTKVLVASELDSDLTIE